MPCHVSGSDPGTTITREGERENISGQESRLSNAYKEEWDRKSL